VVAAVDAVLGEDDVGDGEDDVGGGEDDVGGGEDDVGGGEDDVGDGEDDVGDGAGEEEECLDVGTGDAVGDGSCCDADPRGNGSRPAPGLTFAFEPVRLAPRECEAPDVPPVAEPPAVGPTGVTAVLCPWSTTCDIALTAA
jgi:hypothetical protein